MRSVQHAAAINVRRKKKKVVRQAVREEEKERPFVESENDHGVTTNDSIPKNRWKNTSPRDISTTEEEHAHLVKVSRVVALKTADIP